jgi:hypothetical protein
VRAWPWVNKVDLVFLLFSEISRSRPACPFPFTPVGGTHLFFRPKTEAPELDALRQEQSWEPSGERKEHGGGLCCVRGEWSGGPPRPPTGAPARLQWPGQMALGIWSSVMQRKQGCTRKKGRGRQTLLLSWKGPKRSWEMEPQPAGGMQEPLPRGAPTAPET